jgi:hypothetical protein
VLRPEVELGYHLRLLLQVRHPCTSRSCMPTVSLWLRLCVRKVWGKAGRRPEESCKLPDRETRSPVANPIRGKETLGVNAMNQIAPNYGRGTESVISTLLCRGVIRGMFRLLTTLISVQARRGGPCEGVSPAIFLQFLSSI